MGLNIYTMLYTLILPSKLIIVLCLNDSDLGVIHLHDLYVIDNSVTPWYDLYGTPN